EGPEALPDATRARLLEHHPGFADIALVFGQDDTDPERAATLAGGSRILIAGFIAGVVFIGGGLIGVVLLILFIIGVGTGRIRSRLPKPAPGGSVYFEILPVFATLFLLLMLAMAALEHSTSLDTLTLLKINLAAQWLILPAVFVWPVLRGVPMRKALDDMGWARGQGVIKETAAGVGGYLAGLPLLFAAAIFVQFLALLAGLLGVEEPPPGPNDLMDLFASGDAVLLLLLVSLTTLWAPIVEETVFRGGAFRHLAGRIHWFVAAAFIAIAFAVMHSYSLLLLPILLSLAMVFAVLRYWRGSLIAAVVAHFCQNALATTLMLLILPVT
ncbi:MAG: CPBP family intramembrane glutamic endopeptidase, partial [Planctomycetota bacterium]